MNWQKFWDQQASKRNNKEQVARVSGGKQMGDELLHKIAEKISNQMDLKKEDLVLDVCCGNGALTILIKSFCKEIVGVDFSEKLIESAHETQIKGVQFYCKKAEEFKLNQQFDKVLLYFSFQYFESYEAGKKVIQNLLKHAKPGAIILIGDIPDKRKFFNYYKGFRKLLQYVYQTLRNRNDMGKFWHPKELNQICKELGVQGESIAQEKWQPYSHYRFDYMVRIIK